VLESELGDRDVLNVSSSAPTQELSRRALRLVCMLSLSSRVGISEHVECRQGPRCPPSCPYYGLSHRTRAQIGAT